MGCSIDNMIVPDCPMEYAPGTIPRNSDEKNAEIKKDRELENKIRPQVISILSRGLGLHTSNFWHDDYEDYHHNTDIMVRIPEGIMRIAVRHRAHSYHGNFVDDFCMRFRRKGSGLITEYDKARAGWGDYEFYGFLNEDNTAYEYWYIFDLSQWRKRMDELEYQYGKENLETWLWERSKCKTGDVFIPFNRTKFGYGFVLVDSKWWNGGLFSKDLSCGNVPVENVR